MTDIEPQAPPQENTIFPQKKHDFPARQHYFPARVVKARKAGDEVRAETLEVLLWERGCKLGTTDRVLLLFGNEQQDSSLGTVIVFLFTALALADEYRAGFVMLKLRRVLLRPMHVQSYIYVYIESR